MRVEFIGSTSNINGCPTLFRTERGTLLVQGTRVTDPEALGEVCGHGNGIPDHEVVVEIPAELLRFVDVAALPQVDLDPARPEFVISNPALAEPARP